MSSTARRRRSKRSTKSTLSAISEEPQNESEKTLHNAMVQLIQTKAKTLELHAQWRTYLLFVSFLVLILNLVQIFTPISECLDPELSENWLKTVSNLEPDAIYILMKESKAKIIGILVLVFLMIYIRRERIVFDDPSIKNSQPLLFGNWSYRLSSLFCLLSIFLISTEQTEGPNALSQCMMKTRKEIPVSDIYFLICSGVCSFMNNSLNKIDQNIQFIEKMKKSLKNNAN